MRVIFGLKNWPLGAYHPRNFYEIFFKNVGKTV